MPGKLSRLFRFALTQGMYPGAPAGHNNRVMLARLAVGVTISLCAVAVAVVGVGVNYLATDATVEQIGVFAVGFAAGIGAGFFARRSGRPRSSSTPAFLPPTPDGAVRA